jgi:hypothetical protein
VLPKTYGTNMYPNVQFQASVASRPCGLLRAVTLCVVQGWYDVDCLQADASDKIEPARQRLRALGQHMLSDERRRLPAALAAFREQQKQHLAAGGSGPGGMRWLMLEPELMEFVSKSIAQTRLPPPPAPPVPSAQDLAASLARKPAAAEAAPAAAAAAERKAAARGAEEEKAPEDDVDPEDAQAEQAVGLVQLLEGLGDIITLDRRWVVTQPRQIARIMAAMVAPEEIRHDLLEELVVEAGGWTERKHLHSVLRGNNLCAVNEFDLVLEVLQSLHVLYAGATRTDWQPQTLFFVPARLHARLISGEQLRASAWHRALQPLRDARASLSGEAFSRACVARRMRASGGAALPPGLFSCLQASLLQELRLTGGRIRSECAVSALETVLPIRSDCVLFVTAGSDELFEGAASTYIDVVCAHLGGGMLGGPQTQKVRGRLAGGARPALSPQLERRWTRVSSSV